MRLKIGMLLLLLPSLLWAGGVIIEVEDNRTHPPGMVDRVSLRTANSVTYQDSASFNAGEYDKGLRQTGVFIAPIHTLDSTGVYRRFDYSVLDSIMGIYTHRIRVSSRWGFDYNEDGAFRYIAFNPQGVWKGTLAFTPTFSVDTKFILSGSRVKEILSAVKGTTPDSLVWNWKAKGNPAMFGGSLTKVKIAQWLDGKLLYPTATNAAGDSIGVIRTKTAGALVGDSLPGTMTYWVQSQGVPIGDTVYVDPTVQDTISEGPSGRVGFVDATRSTARDAATAEDALSWNGASAGSMINSYFPFGGSFRVRRMILSFPLSISDATSIDSVRLHFDAKLVAGAFEEEVNLIFAKGTSTGASIQTSWFDELENGGGAGVYSPTVLSGPMNIGQTGGVNTSFSTLFLGAGETEVLAKKDDTLRVFILDTLDVEDKNVGEAVPFSNIIYNEAFNPYLVITYSTGAAGGPASVAGITTTPASVAGLTSRSKTAGIE